VLPYGHQVVGSAEAQAVVRVLASDRLTQGSEVERFEKRLSQACGSRHAVAFSSGTSALHACMAALGIGPGDEVVVPALTFIASCNAVIYTGGRPVVADVDPHTLTLCPRSLRSVIGPATRAVVAVHYAGHPADMAAVQDIASRHDLAVVEDAAHALGSAARHGDAWSPVGSSPGTLAAFSFHPVKAITTAEGGAVTTSSSFLRQRLRTFRHHGIECRSGRGAQDDRIHSLGINGRMSELQAALGAVQLGKLQAFVRRRREIAHAYRKGLGHLDELVLPVEREGVASSWHLYPVRLRLERIRGTRREVFGALRAEGIGVQVHYVPLHVHPHVRRHARVPESGLPVAEAAYAGLLSLPIWPGVTDADADDVIEAVHRVLTYYRR
jgi:perosamine synthetase